jgi:hypothetical protein
MPFLFIIIGTIMLTAAVRNTVSDFTDTAGRTTDGLVTLIKDDFTGPGNFVYWVVSIMLIGAIGYIKPLEPVSRMFLVLVIIVMFIGNKGKVFQQFNDALKRTQTSNVLSQI